METTQIIERNKSSITLTYRNKKQEDRSQILEVTGFDIKVYGDEPKEIKNTLEELEKLGKEKVGVTWKKIC